MLNLIIKGDRFAAAKAAADRHIPLVFVREIKMQGTYFNTVGRTSDQHLEWVVAWFTEDHLPAPFPDGTLLLYGHIDKE